MRNKISPLLKTLTFALGAVALQGCFYGGHPYYSQPAPYAPAYGYARPPAYAYAPPPRVGDYDAHHQWRDRDWWVQNNHAWVQQHHPEWVASQEGHHDYH
jgi:hypothetical protein